MKKILFLLLLCVASLPLLSQKSKVTSASSYIDQGTLDKAKEFIDQALSNEKTRDWFNTYYVKGNLCQAIFESDNPGYKSLYPDPLSEAYLSYERAVELDLKGSVKKRIITQMTYNKLAVNLYNQGGSKFQAKDYEGALRAFETQIKVTENDKYIGSVDTGMYYNAGLAASNARKFNEAIQYFEKCIDRKYLGSGPYYQIASCYLESGDTLKAESVLKTISETFPDDSNVYMHLINICLKNKKYQDASKYANAAKAKYPDNYNVYYIAGAVSLQQNDFKNGIEELSRSIELKSDYFDSHYAMGILFINMASEMNMKANEINDINTYNEAITRVNEIYAKALPYLEKAHELNPVDIDTMRQLQQIYYRLKQKNPSWDQKYSDIKSKIDSISK